MDLAKSGESEADGGSSARKNEGSLLDELPFHVARISLGFQRLAANCLPKDAPSGKFRPGMGSVFFALCEQDDCIIQSLANRLRIPNGTLTGILKSMEGAGLITSRRCPGDGRAKRIELTPFARELEPGLRAGYERAKRILQRNISEEEIFELKRLMGLMLDSMDHEDNWR